MTSNQHSQFTDSRWQRRKDSRSEEILDAALQLFSEKGFSATRIIDVAELAGISKGSLYNYYENKEAIFKAVVQQRISPQLDQVDTLISDFQDSHAELLKLLINRWWVTVICSPLSAIPKIIVSESGNFPDLAHYFTKNVVIRFRDLLSNVIKEGIDCGEFNDLDPQTTSRLIIAPLVQAAIWMHSLKKYDDDLGSQSYLQLHIEFMLNNIVKKNREDADEK